MPLKKGSSKKVISSNRNELINSFHRKGTIGNIKPSSEAKAMEIATAIAYNKAKRGKANPIDQGSSDAPMGMTPGGCSGMPSFLKKK